jgi:hypothetical protein
MPSWDVSFLWCLEKVRFLYVFRIRRYVVRTRKSKHAKPRLLRHEYLVSRTRPDDCSNLRTTNLFVFPNKKARCDDLTPK